MPIKNKLVTARPNPTVYVWKSTRFLSSKPRFGTAVPYRRNRLEQCFECFNIAPTAFLTFHRSCNNRKINSLRLLAALINVVHGAGVAFIFSPLCYFSSLIYDSACLSWIFVSDTPYFYNSIDIVSDCTKQNIKAKYLY